MIISIIAALDKNGGIGKDNALPWHLGTDLRRFKSLTMGHHVIMGRKTYQTIGKILQGRKMIVLTHNRHFSAEGCIVVYSLDEALKRAKKSKENEVFIIGGGDIFTQTIDRVEKIYLTRVEIQTDADVFFPTIEKSAWTEISREKIPASEIDDNDSIFSILVRNH